MNLMTIEDVRGYVKEGTAYLNLEDVARGLGFTQQKVGIEYVRWETVLAYLRDFGFSQQVGKDTYIPENIFYRLAMKAKNETAEAFQAKVADEILPTIRKTGGYVANEDAFIQTYLPHADEQTKLMFRATLETVRKANEKIAVMQPKVDYFDALVERNLLTSFRDTAKELQVKERAFISWLLDRGYVYRDGKGKLKPYAQYVPALFELKEWERNGKADNQTLVTPKGRETFRLLLIRKPA